MIILRNKSYSLFRSIGSGLGGFAFGAIAGGVLTKNIGVAAATGALLGTLCFRNQLKSAKEKEAEERADKEEIEKIKKTCKEWDSSTPQDFKKFVLLCQTKDFICPVVPNYTAPWQQAYDKKQGFFSGVSVYLSNAPKVKGENRQAVMWAHYKNGIWEWGVDVPGQKVKSGKESSLRKVLPVFYKEYYKAYGEDEKYNRESIKRSLKKLKTL